MSAASLQSLADTHVALAELLQRQQEAVVLGDADEGRRRWRDFAALLRAHAAMEDELLMPLFRERGLESPGCSADLLEGEHRKLERLLAEREERLAALPARPDAHARIAWIEGLHVLKEVLDHHDQRERAAFFPALDGALDAAARADLLQRCLARQAELRDAAVED